MADNTRDDEYDDTIVTLLELIYGEGLLAPGGPEEVRNLVGGGG